jgi:hypothetical protein
VPIPAHVLALFFLSRVVQNLASKVPLNRPAEHPLYMKQLQKRHIALFGVLRDHCLFLTRRQIERILTLPTSSTNRELLWLVSEGYLNRRYYADTLARVQTPLYYLGKLAWQVVGNVSSEYKQYRLRIEERSGRQLEHTLAVYDVFLKFLSESNVKRIINGETQLWLEMIDFGNVPDGWIQFDGGEVFIEVDRDTEWGKVPGTKFDNYLRFKTSGSYDKAFPGCTFKVLFITTSERRIEALERIVTSDDIWFCTMEEFLREQLNHAHWFALRGFYALSAATKKEV